MKNSVIAQNSLPPVQMSSFADIFLKSRINNSPSNTNPINKDYYDLAGEHVCFPFTE